MTPPATLLLSALPPRDPGGRDLPARYALVLRLEQSAREVAAQVRAEMAEFDPLVTPISPTETAWIQMDSSPSRLNEMGR